MAPTADLTNALESALGDLALSPLHQPAHDSNALQDRSSNLLYTLAPDRSTSRQKVGRRGADGFNSANEYNDHPDSHSRGASANAHVLQASNASPLSPAPHSSTSTASSSLPPRPTVQVDVPSPWQMRQNRQQHNRTNSSVATPSTSSRYTSASQTRTNREHTQRQQHHLQSPKFNQGNNNANSLPRYDPAIGPVLVCLDLPQNCNTRIFRKSIGAAIKSIFPETPSFRAYVRSQRGRQDYGTLIFPNVDCCNIFMRFFGPQSRRRVEVKKNKLKFEWPRPGTAACTEQVIKALTFKPRSLAVEAISDYEQDDEDKDLDVWVHECEIGSWDPKGRFASAWKSKILDDHYSSIALDGDTAKLTVRLVDRLIVFSLYGLEHLVVHGKDFYIATRVLPTYLLDVSNGVASLKERVGIMKLDCLGMPQKFVRLSGLDDAHAKVAPFCYVVKVRLTSGSHLEAFLYRWKRKLMDIVSYIEIEPSPEQPYRNGILRKINEWFTKSSYELSFQVHYLFLSGLLSPLAVWELTPLFSEVERRVDRVAAATIVRTARHSLRHPNPGEVSGFDSEAFAQRIKELLWQAEEAQRSPFQIVHEDTGFCQIHAAVITPAGLWVAGPLRDSGNRIVRSYPGKESHFLRVRIQEETGDLIRDTRDIDQDEEIFSGKVRTLFLEGLKVGGRLFKFLGFSTSSLREHSTWFVSDFELNGEIISADSIRATIGNLSDIRTPAKYAARMGQAFTSTTFGIDVPTHRRIIIEDIKKVEEYSRRDGSAARREYIFSDGCGTLSRETMNRLHAQDARRRRNKRKFALPAVFQVRIGGAKGVLSLNSDQTGSDVMLRKSMVKFETNEIDHPNSILLEVASSADAPLVTNLNRPLVALLETLGVPASNFLRVQEQAVADIRLAATDTVAALQLYRCYSAGAAADCADLLQTLERVLNLRGITDVAFLKRANLTVLTSALRAIKYKARCRVDTAWTLMGIMDESGLLEEGQIYVQLKEGQDAPPRFLQGWCLVGRSPYLAAGDVQYAQLIGRPPPGHPLLDKPNCVIFSQKGRRPLPSMLSGGDLDGDLYNVIQNPLLLPPRVARAGNFDSETPKELPRAVVWQDVVDFFLLYCQTDRLGMIADRHLCIADRSPVGVEARECEQLARLASIAVDYQKTGVPPDLSRIPRLEDSARPDFTMSEHRVEGRRMKERARWARQNAAYYQSDKALGQMFRAISVNADIDKWGRSIPPVKSEAEVRKLYWNKIRPFLPDNWLPGGDEDMSAVQIYYSELDHIATEYAPERRREALSEEECFMSVILSRFGSRFTGARGYSAQVGLRDEFQGLIDKTLSNFCDTQDWEDPLITPKRLKDLAWNYATPENVRATRLQQWQSDRAAVQDILVRLARWIRASEMFEESQAPESRTSANRRVVGGAEESETWTNRRYEGAKWIAIGPALKKVEELERWNQWHSQMMLNMGSRAV